MAVETDEASGQKEDITRLLALSDGVFAVAITLLVLDIRIPNDVPSDQLLSAILALEPALLSYIVSFLVIALYWNSHRRIFRVVRRSDGLLTWLNIVFLLSISFLPVPTSVIGRYSGVTAVVFYALSLSVTGILAYLLWWHVSRGHRLIDANMSVDDITSASVSLLMVPAIFLLSIGLAFVNIFAPIITGPSLAQYSWILIWVLNIVYRRSLYRRRAANRG